MLIGYARTSTDDQVAGLEAQVRDLTGAGCDKCFSEQVSSVNDLRPQLQDAIAALNAGDALVVTKPDRLARSTMQLLSIVNMLEKAGIGLVVLSMGGERLDTRNPTSKLMLTILGGIATWEREIMLERQQEGIAKAREAGKYKGRPSTLVGERLESALAMLDQGDSQREVARKSGFGKDVLRRALARLEKGRFDAIPEASAA